MKLRVELRQDLIYASDEIPLQSNKTMTPNNPAKWPKSGSLIT